MKSALAIAAQVRSGEASASAILADTLVRIRARDPAINAFTARVEVQAARDAAAVDAAVALAAIPDHWRACPSQ